MNSRVQIIVTVGPSSEKPEMLRRLIEGQMDVARINFAWIEAKEAAYRIDAIRATALTCGRTIPIIADLPGPRVQRSEGHSYDVSAPSSLTEGDEEVLRLCAEKEVEYVAISFVGSEEDVRRYREAIKNYGGAQKIIAKIERKAAIDAIDGILAASDAVMVARGDLGNEVPLEEIPFVQRMLIAKANAARKPVITATQMLFSMTERREPTRAEVTDVETAVRDGSDAVMLSEETSTGHFPMEAVAMMERIITAAERHSVEHPLHLL
jgi:pyruvate kinase